MPEGNHFVPLFNTQKYADICGEREREREREGGGRIDNCLFADNQSVHEKRYIIFILQKKKKNLFINLMQSDSAVHLYLNKKT